MIAPLTDDLKRFTQVEKVFIFDSKDKEVVYRIRRSRIFQGKILLQLEEVEDRNKADSLKGKYLEIEKKDVPPASPDRYYLFDLVGCKVESLKGKMIGEVKEVLFSPVNPVLVVRKDKKEYYIPFVKEVVKEVNLEEKLIYIEPLNGLLD